MSPSQMPPTPPALVERFELVLERFPGLARRKMFGYPAAFLPAGHMVSGLHGSSWLVRLDEAAGAELIADGGTTFEPMPGRRMGGFYCLPPTVVADDAALGGWIERAVAHAESLPPKRSPSQKLEGRSSAG